MLFYIKQDCFVFDFATNLYNKSLAILSKNKFKYNKR